MSSNHERLENGAPNVPVEAPLTEEERRQMAVQKEATRRFVAELDEEFGIAERREYQHYQLAVSSLELPQELTEVLDVIYFRKGLVPGLAEEMPLMVNLHPSYIKVWPTVDEEDQENPSSYVRRYSYNHYEVYFLLERPPKTLNLPGGRLTFNRHAGVHWFEEQPEGGWVNKFKDVPGLKADHFRAWDIFLRSQRDNITPSRFTVGKPV